MADNNLEERVKPDQNSHGSGLEAKTNSSATDLFEVLATGALGIVFGGSDLETGLMNYASVAGTYSLAHAIFERDKLSPKSIMNEFKMAGLYTPALFALFKIANPILDSTSSYLLKGAYALGGLAVSLPLILSHYLSSEDAVKNYSSLTDYFANIIKHPFKTMYKSMRYVSSNLGSSLKHVAYLVPFIIADMLFVPFAYQLAASSLLRFGFRSMMAVKDKPKEEQQTQLLPQPA